MSLDLFKAYDRTNLSFLKRVMSAMNFSEEFISWILLLHEGAKTRLLLDFLTEPIDVLFSVRQGDPLAMILFILYIEPLFMKLERELHGFSLEAPLLGGPPVSFEAANESQEGYVDDAELIIVKDSEFIVVDRIVETFEQMSGAILNRSSKSKVLGLGRWKD